ncbi:MAG: hypothetical protein ACYDAK_13040 [Candidatus Limnocylindrales bacterium]
MTALRRSAASQMVAIPGGLAGSGIPAGMGGGVGAQVNVGASGDGTSAIVVLAGGVALLVLFYLWTRNIQGGP